MAKALGIAVKTIDGHMALLTRKAGVGKRSALVAFCLGLIAGG